MRVFFMYNALEDFLNECEIKHLSMKTIKSYNANIMMFIRYCENKGITDVEDVRHQTIVNYIDFLLKRDVYDVGYEIIPELAKRVTEGHKISKITINGYIRCLRVWFNYLTEYDYVVKNPMSKIKQLKVDRPPVDFVTDEEFAKLLKNLDKSSTVEYRDGVLIQFLLDTGCRIGETLMIKKEDIDFSKNRIYLPWEHTKGKKARYVFFSDEMRKTLKAYLRHIERFIKSDLLFPNLYGKQMQINSIESNIREYGRRIGVNITPKTFRNNAAKRMLLNGMDIFTVSKILGHSSVQVTEKAYMDLDADDIRSEYLKYSPIKNMKVH